MAPFPPAESAPLYLANPLLRSRPSQGPGPKPKSLGKGVEQCPLGLREQIPADWELPRVPADQWRDVRKPDHVRPVWGYQNHPNLLLPYSLQEGREETEGGKSVQQASRPPLGQGV